MIQTTDLANVFAHLYQCEGIDVATLVAAAASVRYCLPAEERAFFTEGATMSGLPLEVPS